LLSYFPDFVSPNKFFSLGPSFSFVFVVAVRAKQVSFILSNNSMSRIDRFLQTWQGVDFEALIADYAVDPNPAEPDERPDVAASPVTPAVSQEESATASTAENVTAGNVAEQSTDDAAASTASASAALDIRPVALFAVRGSSSAPATAIIAPAAKASIRQQQRSSKA
jgi:hypothetical protein